MQNKYAASRRSLSNGGFKLIYKNKKAANRGGLLWFIAPIHRRCSRGSAARCRNAGKLTGVVLESFMGSLIRRSRTRATV